ncbi:MAG TPA: RbsD/FucU domain-containing protein [Acidobacteriaceae bacterium]
MGRMRMLGIMALGMILAPMAWGQDWHAKLAEAMPLMGHRNWVLVVDSAYPLQSSPGVETIDTGRPMGEVLSAVLQTIDRAPHVRPDVFMDAELPFVPEADAPGVTRYREELPGLLHGEHVQTKLHEKLIAQVGEAGASFHVLVLKTTLTVPYSSVFLRLNCRYWSDAAEARMRAKMGTSK